RFTIAYLFFFQAEDGIRAFHVTGVQTCALPIYRDGLVGTTDAHSFWAPELARWVDAVDLEPGTWLRTSAGTWAQVSAVTVRTARSEERRVGEEDGTRDGRDKLNRDQNSTMMWTQ